MHLTSINSYFHEIISNTERDLLSALLTHYHHICDPSAEKTKSILKEITETLNLADGPTTLAHTETMKLTEANLFKRQNTLDKRSRNKSMSSCWC